MKKNFWIIEAVVSKRFKVVFEEEVDMSEAIDLFKMQENIEDIIDETDIIEVVSVEEAE